MTTSTHRHSRAYRVIVSAIAATTSIAIAAVVPARATPIRSVTIRATTPLPPVWLAALDGGVFTLGSAPFRGSLGGEQPPPLTIAFAADHSGQGYWLVGFDGAVRAFGDAPNRGSLRGIAINQPIVGIAATPSGNGYWLVATDGGVFTFGDAHFFGSLGGTRLNQPIAGIVATRDGRGYWLVAADGGVFTFGDAHFFGSLGATRLTQPIATLAALPNGRGYWILDRAGRVFPFGSATSFGNIAGARTLAAAIVPTKSGRGYWIASAGGVIRAFGDAVPLQLPSIALRAPIMGMATPWASSSGTALALLDSLRLPGRTWPGGHEVALTFDDGPSQFTPAVLAVLARYGVRATFFTVGYVAATRPDLLIAEARAGMSVEIHSWDHADLTKLSVGAIDDELVRSADLVQQVIGRRPTCFRPPYGSTNHTVAAVGANLGFTQILWNVDPSDYLRPGAGTIVSRVLGEANGRGLVVGIHDGGGDRSQTVAALPAIIEGLRARGYTFVPLCN